MIAVHTSSENAIEFRRIHRNFGNVRAVDDISFSVPVGSVCGYIGPNGAGKTTTMRILATLDIPNYGDALVNGYSSVVDPDRVRKRLGFMPDGFGAYAHTSVTEYLDFFARASGLVGKERMQRVNHVLDFTKLRVLEEKPIKGLSKGMRQRLCLGRALIHNPNVLVLDEPANGLDPRARIELRQMIRALATEKKTILVSSHILSELAEMCDMVAIVEKGKLLAVGSVEDIRRQAAPVRRCELRVLGDGTKAREVLATLLSPEDWEEQDQRFLLRLHGDEQQQVQVIRELVIAGVAVYEFKAESHSLEEIFLHVTKGLLQ